MTAALKTLLKVSCMTERKEQAPGEALKAKAREKCPAQELMQFFSSRQATGEL